MNKTKLWEVVQELLAQHKANAKLTSALEELLAPKSGGGIQQNPMQTVDDVNYHYCRYTQAYIAESEIVMSNNKSKGYSKKAIAQWTKLGKQIQALESEAMQLLLTGDIEAGKVRAAEAEALKTARNQDAELYAEVAQYYKDNGLSI